jgi:hypothetical protein
MSNFIGALAPNLGTTPIGAKEAERTNYNTIGAYAWAANDIGAYTGPAFVTPAVEVTPAVVALTVTPQTPTVTIIGGGRRSNVFSGPLGGALAGPIG